MSLSLSDIPIYHFNEYFNRDRMKVLQNFSCALLGAPGTGKTSTIKYFIKRLNADETHIFAAHLDDWNGNTLKGFKQHIDVSLLRDGTTMQEPEEKDEEWYKKWKKVYQGMTTVDLFLAKMIQDRQMHPQESSEKMPSRLIILDDVTSELKKLFSPLSEILDNLRHYNVHVIVVSHAPLSIPPQLRARFRFQIDLQVILAESSQLRALRQYFMNRIDARNLRLANESLFDESKALVCKTQFNVDKKMQKVAIRMNQLEWLRKSEIVYLLKDDVLGDAQRRIPRKLAPEQMMRFALAGKQWDESDEDDDESSDGIINIEDPEKERLRALLRANIGNLL